MKEIPYGFGQKGLPLVIRQLGALYKNPLEALKEYVTNSIDNAVRGKKQYISIKVGKARNRIIITDNGLGLTPEEMSKLPTILGESTKRDIKDMRGEKGLGMLAYHGVGGGSPHTMCTIYSRKYGSKHDMVSILRMYADKVKATQDEIKGTKIPHGEFEYGTRVVIEHIPQRLFSRWFTPAEIRRIMSLMYDPLIRRGETRIDVEHAEGKKMLVEPAEYRGKLELSKTLTLDVADHISKKPVKGEIQLQIYLNPQGINEKVAAYNKGVRVFDALDKLDELDVSPWNLGKLTGFIDEDFLELTAPRDGYIRDDNFAIWLDGIEGNNEHLVEVIEINKPVRKKHQAAPYAQGFARALSAVFDEVAIQYSGLREMVTTGRYRPPNPPIPTVKTDGPDTDRTEEEHKRVKPGEPPTHSPKPLQSPREGPEEGKERKGLPILRPHFDIFGPSRSHIRAELAEGKSDIWINEGHPDYERLSKGQDKYAFNDYIALLLSEQAAFYVFNSICQDKAINPIDAGKIMSNLAADLFYGAKNIFTLEGEQKKPKRK